MNNLLGHFKRVFGVVLYVAFGVTDSFSQSDAWQFETVETDADFIQAMVDKHHCCPRVRNEQYYNDIAYLFISRLDPFHIYFTKADVAALSDSTLIKEAIDGKNNAYVEKATLMYRSSLSTAKLNVERVVAAPFDFLKDEMVRVEPDSIGFASDTTQLKQRVYQRVKFNTLTRMVEAVLADSVLEQIAFVEREKTARETEGKVWLRRIDARFNTRYGFRGLMDIYFNDAILKANDPHSQFMPKVVMDYFSRIEKSAGSKVFGFNLQETYNGDVMVTGIIPNSPAWRSGKINVGDVVVSLQVGQRATENLEGMTVGQVLASFAGEKEDLKITFRKADGQLNTVALSRGVISNAETGVETFILNGPKKIAYIIMPSFYSSWESVDGSSCADDMIRDLEKLQFEVDGLIIDMRYNGGGSLQEANQMAGIFIDEGTLGFRKQRGGFSVDMKDPLMGAAYQEPIIVMVNNESASATEYVAAALQDFNRAIIVGSPTFGKATAQRYMPVDPTIDRVDMNKGSYDSPAEDWIKITVGKLYRPSGLNNQLRGVQPDIYLPTVTDSVNYREAMMVSALPLDTFHRKGQFDAFAPIPIRQLSAQSEARLKASPVFNQIKKAAILNGERKKIMLGSVSLKYSSYLEWNRKLIAIPRRTVAELENDSAGEYLVRKWNRPFAEPDLDPVDEEGASTQRKHIARDPYIRECYAIMKDWLELVKKN